MLASRHGSIRPDSISCSEAIRLLHSQVAKAVTEADPAPWYDVSSEAFKMSGDDDEAAYVRRMKLQERTKRLMQRALLTGALQAHFSDGLEAQDIPGWAWVGVEKYDFVWFHGTLPLDAFLPDNWQRWSNGDVFFSRPALEQWLDCQDFASAFGLPDLPAPHDAHLRPEPIKRRLPPDRPFVTLSEALSWIAFGISFDRDRLDQALNGRRFGSVDAYSLMEQAMEHLAINASGGRIALRGKYIEHPSIDIRTVLTESIAPIRLDDFAKFDILRDSLCHGKGLVWVSRGGFNERMPPAGRRDAYQYVTVDRADLLENFPNPLLSEGALQVPLPARPSHDEVVAWCRRWIADGKGNGMDPAWLVFRADPAHSGLTREDVFRPAWREAKGLKKQ